MTRYKVTDSLSGVEVSAEVSGRDVDFLLVEIVVGKERFDVTRALPARLRAKIENQLRDRAEDMDAEARDAATEYALDQAIDESKGS